MGAPSHAMNNVVLVPEPDWREHAGDQASHAIDYPHDVTLTRSSIIGILGWVS